LAKNCTFEQSDIKWRTSKQGIEEDRLIFTKQFYSKPQSEQLNVEYESELHLIDCN